MRGKIVEIIKRYWVIPVSILLWYYPIMPIGLMICAIIGLTTGSEYISVIVSMIGIGVVSSIPIIIKLKKAERLTKNRKYVLICISVLVFTLISYYLGIVMM